MVKINNLNKFNNYSYIIAEIGINHDGKIKKAYKLIDLAKKSGVDAVKFQIFKPETLAIKKSEKTNQQKKLTRNTETLYNMIKRLSFGEKEIKLVKKRAKKKKLDFICSVFDEESLKIAKKVGIDAIKIASSDITDLNLIKKISKLKKIVIISTGMANQNEITNALKILKKNKVYVLHCVSMYPTKILDINLLRMLEIKKKLKVDVGFSDHTIGTDASIAAITLGAKIIEKHFTDNKKNNGPDHVLSADYTDMKKISQFSNDISKIFGKQSIKPSKKESGFKKFFRKGLYAKKNISKFEKVSTENTIIRRPQNNFPIERYQKTLGKKFLRNYNVNESILKKSIK